MTEPPPILPFDCDWLDYVERVYEAFIETFVCAEIAFQGHRVTAPRLPETQGKHASFWHIISEAPHPGNRQEEDRVPAIGRCERIRWIGWAIRQADLGAEAVSWWENTRGRDTHVVIWVEAHDFAVVLGKRRGYYVLKTAYNDLRSGRRKAFEKEKSKFWRAYKG